MPEEIGLSKWNQLLATIGIDEREALNAIVLDSKIGLSLRRFVRDSARYYFVPEDALHAVSLYRELICFSDEG